MNKTILYDRHLALEAKMVEFYGWEMPLHYTDGIIEEHLYTRSGAGLFDISHMGRFEFRGKGAVPFLQHVLTNNARALNICQSQYTIISNSHGGAVDDAYLYRFFKDEYILVVNAGNRQSDWDYFRGLIRGFKEVEMQDKTKDLAMFSLQGPLSKVILNNVIDSGFLPEPLKNQLSIVRINGSRVLVGRTGYTGEPLGFELFISSNDALKIWDILMGQGAAPVGLGARDTLRLEAGLPLYGHELGLDAQGKEIPVFASPLSKFAVSFSPLKGDFVGKDALKRQFEALGKIIDRDYSLIKNLPRRIMPLRVVERGVVRAGFRVFSGESDAGYVTSGTMVPCYKFEGGGILSKITNEREMRSICLALIDSNLNKGDKVDIEIRGRRIKAVVVPFHLSSTVFPYARPVPDKKRPADEPLLPDRKGYAEKVQYLLNKTVENTIWRQSECINLIPSEQTPSPMVRLVSIMDPAFRYGEHKRVPAFYDMDIFYYQGTDFIKEVERDG